jgi:hypothetical protein
MELIEDPGQYHEENTTTSYPAIYMHNETEAMVHNQTDPAMNLMI